MIKQSVGNLIKELAAIPGGYVYYGACSVQYCFPLKAGGELRISMVDDDVDSNVPTGQWHADLYKGELPPCITGYSNPTGNK